MATTVIDNFNHGTRSGPVKGRRKLEFSESQRFKGKHFFLDLDGYKRAKEVAAELTARGASVEKFLDKRVRYLITNKPNEAIERAKANVSTKNNPHTPSTGGLSQIFSPYSTGQSPHTEKKSPSQPHYFTRSQKMLNMVVSKSDKVDTLLMAVRCGCKILPVEAVEKELKKLKPFDRKKSIDYKKPTAKYVRKLRRPFFKVEDLSRQYRPIIYEPSVWPIPNFSCPANVSPFDVNNTREPVSDRSRSSKKQEDVNEEEDMIEDQEHQEDKDEEQDEKRPGYCEPCAVRYEDLRMHLMSISHQKYANNEKNFAKLDELMSQCTSLSEFLAEERRKTRSSKTPESQATPPQLRRSPRIKEAQLSLRKIASPALPVAKRPRLDHGSHESQDHSTKRTRLTL